MADTYYVYIVKAQELIKEGGNMRGKQKKLAREQLDETMKSFGPLKAISAPGKGWIRAIRDMLGMTGVQLAKRLNVTTTTLYTYVNGDGSLKEAGAKLLQQTTR